MMKSDACRFTGGRHTSNALKIRVATTEAAASHDDAVSVRKWTGAVDELLAALDHARSVARKPRDGPGA